MAKISYNIPTDLDKNYLDLEITIQNDNGVGLKPLALKVIFFYIASIFALVWFFRVSFMKDAIFLVKVAFVILWFLMTFILAKYTSTKQMQAQMITSLLNYIPHDARHVILRSGEKATKFWAIVGIEGIDDNTGLVKYTDGTYAFFYRVVGSASILLFDEDRDSIIDRVDSFHRKMGTDVEFIKITTKESQKVHHQVAALQHRYNNLEFECEDLRDCMQEQYNILENHVGHEFKSIHQYFIIKADNIEALKIAKNVLQSEVENSSKIFKQCTLLYSDDIYEILQNVYANPSR